MQNGNLLINWVPPPLKSTWFGLFALQGVAICRLFPCRFPLQGGASAKGWPSEPGKGYKCSSDPGRELKWDSKWEPRKGLKVEFEMGAPKGVESGVRNGSPESGVESGTRNGSPERG
jgi:hypothetical protein